MSICQFFLVIDLRFIFRTRPGFRGLTVTSSVNHASRIQGGRGCDWHLEPELVQ